MDMWPVFNVFVWIFAVIGAVFSFLYLILTWYVYYAFKIASPEENFTARLKAAIVWPFFGIKVASDMAHVEFRDRERRAKTGQESNG